MKPFLSIYACLAIALLPIVGFSAAAEKSAEPSSQQKKRAPGLELYLNGLDIKADHRRIIEEEIVKGLANRAGQPAALVTGADPNTALVSQAYCQTGYVQNVRKNFLAGGGRLIEERGLDCKTEKQCRGVEVKFFPGKAASDFSLALNCSKDDLLARRSAGEGKPQVSLPPNLLKNPASEQARRSAP